MQDPKLLALQLREAKEQDRVWEAQKGIRESPPGPERERQRSLYDAAFEALQRAGEAMTLWKLRRSRIPSEEDEMDFAEAREAVQEGLLDLGYSYPIQTSRERGKKVRVVYHDPSGEKHSAAVRFHEVEKWLDGLAEPPEPDLDQLAREQGKTIVNGELVELPENEDWMDTSNIVIDDAMRHAVAAKIGAKIVTRNGKEVCVSINEEEPVEEIVKEEPVEETITYVEVNDTVAQLRAAEKSNDILLVQYKARSGEVSARFIRVMFVSKDGKRFGVQDDQSHELRSGWYTASVLKIYPAVEQKEMRGYADLLSGYKKGSDKVCMLPYDGHVVISKLPMWVPPDNVASLEASGNWIRK